jgi:hypothetical protein
MLNKAGFTRVKVLNSQPSQGDPYSSLRIFGKKGAYFLKKAIFLTSQGVFYLTFGKWMVGSSLLVYARKAF